MEKIGSLIDKTRKKIDITSNHEMVEVEAINLKIPIDNSSLAFELSRCFVNLFYPINKKKLEQYIDIHGNERGKSYKPFILEFSKNIEIKGINMDKVEHFMNYCKEQAVRYDNLNYFDLSNFFIPVLENYNKILQKARQEEEEMERKTKIQSNSKPFKSYSDFLNRENKNVNGMLAKEIENEIQLTIWQEQNETNKGCWNVKGWGKNNVNCTNSINISNCENCEGCENIKGQKGLKNVKEKSIFQKLNEQRKRTTLEEREREEAEIRKQRREKRNK